MDKEALLKIGRPGKKCINCEAPLAELSKNPTAVHRKKEGLERLDYCPECWDVIKRDAYDFFWVTRREKKPKAALKLTRKERNAALRALFESLWDRRESEDVGPHLFLLSHLLMKWGGLKFREEKETEEGRTMLVFEDPISGDRLAVEAMDLADERILELKEEIDDFLREFTSDEDDDL